MSFFRRLFGGGDEKEAPAEAAQPEPAAPAAPAETAVDDAPADAPVASLAGDPYRDVGSVSEPREREPEVVVIKKTTPIWHWRSRVLCIEPGERLPLRSLVYTGTGTRPTGTAIRRITFGTGGYRVDWEEHTRFEDAIEEYIVCVEDRVIIPGTTGVVAVHVVTGERCWELPHPGALVEKPLLDPAGDLLFVFSDQRWMIVSPRDGATRSEGAVSNDRDVARLKRSCRSPLSEQARAIEYGGCRVDARANELVVMGSNHREAGDPVAPTHGSYSLDGEWSPEGWVALAGGKLAVELRRSWNNRTATAIGLFDPTSLEPLQLLELGGGSGSKCWVVDDLFAVYLDVKDGTETQDSIFIIDPHAERVVACFAEDQRDSYLFDRSGARIWAKPL